MLPGVPADVEGIPQIVVEEVWYGGIVKHELALYAINDAAGPIVR